MKTFEEFLGESCGCLYPIHVLIYNLEKEDLVEEAIKFAKYHVKNIIEIQHKYIGEEYDIDENSLQNYLNNIK